jgi:DNA-directed RNA polymerase specialized sigma24 family protein
MTNSTTDNSKNRQNVNSEAFARFLESLSPDTEEAGRLYTQLHKKLVGFFRLKGVSDPVSAADDTIDRAAVKIHSGVPVPDVDKYCLGIARNIAKERFRRAQREHSTFLNFTESLANNSNEQVARIYDLLKPCFDQLTVEEQNLLSSYCQLVRGRARAEHRRELAEKMQTTVLALRMRVTRLRGILADCVKKNTQNNGLSTF